MMPSYFSKNSSVRCEDMLSVIFDEGFVMIEISKKLSRIRFCENLSQGEVGVFVSFAGLQSPDGVRQA